MKFKIKDLNIATGGILVAILTQHDAKLLDLHVGDRIVVRKGRSSTVAVLDISQPPGVVKNGEIGLMEEVLKQINAEQGNQIDVAVEKKPTSLHMIKKKLEGKKLTSEEIDTIVRDVVDNKLTSVEIAYFVAGTFTKGMTLNETVDLTKAMINTGDRLVVDRHPIVDKHCIGGVAGNRTTMIVVPILLAAGYCVPKTSSRSITSPAGTADTMEVLANVDLSLEEVTDIVEDIGGCMTWGGAVNLSPADDKFITVERPLSIDAEAQLLASILAKKGSVSATHVLIDIPVGPGAKVTTMSRAKRLKKLFETVGRKLKMKMHVVITDGSQPIGNGIGPSLEARDVLWVLGNYDNAPQDLKEKSIKLAGEIMKTYPLPYWKAGHGLRYAREILESGKAFESMKEIIKAQGKKIDDPSKIKVGKFTYDYTAWKTGTVKHISNGAVSRIAKIAGAPLDQGAGIYMQKHVGDSVKKNEVIFTIYSESKQKLEFAKDHLNVYDGVAIE